MSPRSDTDGDDAAEPKRVVVLGCGYVGTELGRQLTAAGHDVVGVRRSEEGLEAMEAAGFDAVCADVTDAASLEPVPDADWLVFAASSGGRDADAAREVFVDGQRTALAAFGERDDGPERYVYTSSTGVYGDHGGDWVDEETEIRPTTEKTRVLAAAERVAREVPREYGFDGTVARFAGLYGPKRYRLERYLEGPVTEGYLNMVHRDDAAGAIAYLLERDHGHDGVVLVVDDEPAEKWAFADWLADECGVERPSKRTKAERLDAGDLLEAARRRILTSKRCSNALLRELGYEFRYPDYRAGYATAIEQYRRRER
ncbi:SDR family oxidoreductase [Haloprofundus halobius]|uniref:SDR family oxidoreductase n=1 Tax=Haloprofundus halobius TaxID=2876194 RepID=UPI001CCAAC15|nr:SDR family oxidoreductase [Haloprofundus halobius]